ncbi:UNVERIFIED_CONTAM: putative protein ycf45 [Sesamum calycinum]|uniref:AAA+ ATPase domain-containing protein n=1 Tax=Sesamum calycinum TaxID=2727403 RepID=A0AAW2J7I8_9LAMI
MALVEGDGFCGIKGSSKEKEGNTSTVEANRAQLLEFGRPGVGKATVIRGISHVLSYEHLKRVICALMAFGLLSFFSYFGLLLGLTLTFSIWRSSTRRIRTATEETLQQFCCCTFVLLLPLRFAPAAAVLLLLLLHFASADAAAAYYSAAAAAFRLLLLRFATAAATLCCCVLLLPQLRFANAAAVFCCCCSLLRGRNPMVLTGSLAWEGTNSHNCGMIISSIKTNSTKEISNHDQVTLDLGRLPQACYLGDSGKRDLRKKEVSIEELEYAQNALGEFGGNNRTGIAGTLHRISAIRNKNGRVVGLTCRLGRPVREIIDMTRDLLEYGKSILFLGRPGVGKTTVIRGISHVLSYELLKRVIVVDTSNEIGDIRESVSIVSLSCGIWIPDVDFQMQIVVDTSNEIGGDGDIPHPAIGGARRLQVRDPCTKHKVMIEAVDNHMPERISLHSQSKLQYTDTRCRFSDAGGARRLQVPDPCTKHKVMIEAVDNHMPEVGGLKTVILSDEAARTRNCKKIILERRSAPAFPFLIEMRERDYWVAHRSSTILVDDILELYNMMLIAFTLLLCLCLCWPWNTSTVEANRAQLLEFGRPGVGKTTVIRGISHVLSYELLKRVIVVDTSNEIGDIRESVSIVSLSCGIWIPDVDFQMQIVVDTSNEIGGDGDIPHPAIGEHGDCRYQRISLHSQSKLQYTDTRCRFSDAGGARRLQVPDPCTKHKVMIEAVDNHMPERISLHSQSKLQFRIPDVDFQMQVGGLKTVILSDEAARTRNCKKIILERRSAPAFPFLIEMRERDYWVAHRSSTILVDDILELYNMMLIAFTLLLCLCLCWPWNTSTVEANRAQLLEFGRPGVGKATVIRISHVLSYEHLKRVICALMAFGLLSFFSYFGLLLGLTLTFSIWRSSTRRIRTATEETLQQFCCCTFVLLLPLRFAPAAAVLLLLLLHFASADAAAALLLCCRCCVSLLLLLCYCCSFCCCVLLLPQLRFANAAAVFCCCCSLLRGRNPMVLTGSLAWEGTNSHNCGLIISSIKTNSTKEISNHDQVWNLIRYHSAHPRSLITSKKLPWFT